MASFKTEEGLKQLNEILASRSYFGADLTATSEDFKVFDSLSGVNHETYPNVYRWHRHLTHLRATYPLRQWPKGNAPSTGKQPQSAPQAAAAAAKESKPAATTAPAKENKQAAKAAPAKAKAQAKAPAAASAGLDEDDDAAAKVQLLVGRVTKVWDHADSDKLFCEEIDCGEGTLRQIGSGLRPFYKAEEFEGRLVVVVANLKPKKLAGFPSNGMVLCASNADHTEVKFVDVPADAKPGDRVTFGDLPMQEAAAPNFCDKKKLFIKAQPHFTSRGGVCYYKDKPMTLPSGQCTAPVGDGWSLS